MNIFIKAAGGFTAAMLLVATVAAYHKTSAVQVGARGVAMEIVETNDRLADKVRDNIVPTPLPPAPPGGQLSVDAYKNVQVLGHVSSAEFTRLMLAITTWVAPNQGCVYCHAAQKDAAGNVVKDDDGQPQADLNRMWSDELYTKRVARRMLQMTQRLNGDWNVHVKETGVTCYTCHRGNPVPANIWFDAPEAASDDMALGYKAGQNSPSDVAALASLPGALRPFLVGDENIRVQSMEALPGDNRSSVKQTEWTYGLMMHMSKSLGVNCTHCHNTRSMGAWSASPATRATAWYGIRMVREINNEYLEPLKAEFPASRLGPTGDVPKTNCATCHAGAYKPLLGVSMLKDYAILAEAKPQPQKTVVLTMPGMAADARVDTMLAADGGAAMAGGAGAASMKTLDAGAAQAPNVLQKTVPSSKPAGHP